MDLLTQGLAGAVLARAAARRGDNGIAALVGFAAGLLADIDVLIRSSEDPLLVLEYHRHFTHALAFVPVGALLAALLLWPFLRQRLPPGRLYLYALLGYATSGILDACTSYGTHLLWPFVSEPVSWSVIAIVDPLFTLGLVLALWWALRRNKVLAARLGILFAVGYLALGAFQHQRALAVATDLALSRGHPVERALVKPTLGNLVLWRSVYESRGEFHVDAVRVGFGAPRVYAGSSAARFDADDSLVSPGSRSRVDIERFIAFADCYAVRVPGTGGAIGDVRFANLPTSTAPLWGIEFAAADGAERFAFYRDASPQTRRRFLDMLLGRD